MALLAVVITAPQIAAASGAPGLVATLLIAAAVAAVPAGMGARLGLRLGDRGRACSSDGGGGPPSGENR